MTDVCRLSAALPPQFCPRCGAQEFVARDNKRLDCRECGFAYYHNVAGAVAAVIRNGDHIALGIRAKDPGAGYLGFPGGFVDPGESLEAALVREVREEFCVDVTDYHYLFSMSNDYVYRDVAYTTIDAYFECTVANRESVSAGSEMRGVEWLLPSAIDHSRLAFDSAREAIKRLGQISESG